MLSANKMQSMLVGALSVKRTRDEAVAITDEVFNVLKAIADINGHRRDEDVDRAYEYGKADGFAAGVGV